MEPTRRLWQAVLSAGLLIAAALLFQRPLLLAGAAAVGAFLLAVECDFVHTLGRTDEQLTVTQTVPAERVPVEEAVTASVTVDRADASETRLTVELTLPAGLNVVTGDRNAVSLAPGEQTVTETVDIVSPVAGRHTLEQPSLTITDTHRWFEERIERGAATTVTAEPETPRNISVGHEGDELVTGLGDYQTDRFGPTVEPSDLREYEPGDAASRIDWKATARLDDAYVRDFQTGTDRTVRLVFDHRRSMGEGEPVPKLAYAREVALAVLGRAMERTDPVALSAVDDDGITLAERPGTATDHYERLRVELLGLDAAGETTGPAGTDREPPERNRSRSFLAGSDSTFGRTLAPFFETGPEYVQRVDDQPLFRAVQTLVARQRTNGWTVLFTDDTNRREVLEAVKLARQNDAHVIVFLTPGVLFDPDALVRPDAAYDRYRTFESFRHRLERLSRVSAFEIGPDDRIAKLIETRRSRRRSA